MRRRQAAMFSWLHARPSYLVLVLLVARQAANRPLTTLITNPNHKEEAGEHYNSHYLAFIAVEDSFVAVPQASINDVRISESAT